MWPLKSGTFMDTHGLPSQIQVIHGCGKDKASAPFTVPSLINGHLRYCKKKISHGAKRIFPRDYNVKTNSWCSANRTPTTDKMVGFCSVSLLFKDH